MQKPTRAQLVVQLVRELRSAQDTAQQLADGCMRVRGEAAVWRQVRDMIREIRQLHVVEADELTGGLQ